MNFLLLFLLISCGIICNAWFIPMEKKNIHNRESDSQNDLAKQADMNDINGEDDIPEKFDLTEVIGIKIAKYTRADPVMQVFDFDMNLARKFAFNEWQNLLQVYSPVLGADIVIEQVESVHEQEGAQSATNSPKLKENTKERNIGEKEKFSELLKNKENDFEDPLLLKAQSLGDERVINKSQNSL